MYDFAYRDMIERAGGIEGTVKLCAKFAPTTIPPTPNAVAVWLCRGKIAADWVPTILAGLDARGIPPTHFLRKWKPPIVRPEDTHKADITRILKGYGL